MDRRLAELFEARGRLRERIAQERHALARAAQPLASACARADAALALTRTAITTGRRILAQHPWLAAAAVGVLVALRPRRVLSWTARAFTLWQAARRLRPLIAWL